MNIYDHTTTGRFAKHVKHSMETDPKGNCIAYLIGFLIAIGLVIFGIAK